MFFLCQPIAFVGKKEKHNEIPQTFPGRQRINFVYVFCFVLVFVSAPQKEFVYSPPVAIWG